MRPTFFLCASLLTLALTLRAQAPTPLLDLGTIGRIRTEAIQHSQALDHVWWLSEVHGPRATGTPGLSQASEWVMIELHAPRKLVGDVLADAGDPARG